MKKYETILFWLVMCVFVSIYGGGSKRWYGANNSVLKFDKPSYNELLTVGNHLPSREYYFKKGITWSLISSGGSISARTAFLGSAFDVGGSCGFSDDNFYYLGLLSSKVAGVLLEVINPTINKQVGDLKVMPVIKKDEVLKEIDDLSEETYNLSKEDWDSFETSFDFKKSPII